MKDSLNLILLVHSSPLLLSLPRPTIVCSFSLPAGREPETNQTLINYLRWVQPSLQHLVPRNKIYRIDFNPVLKKMLDKC